MYILLHGDNNAQSKCLVYENVQCIEAVHMNIVNFLDY